MIKRTVHVGWDSLVQTYEGVTDHDIQRWDHSMIATITLEKSMVYLQGFQWLEVIYDEELK